MNDFWIEFQRGYESIENNASALSHWIWDQESHVDAQIAFLEKEQAENIDGDETTISRTRLTAVLLELARCISRVNATVHLDYTADERAIEDTERIAAKQQEAEATVKLPDCIGAVDKAIDGLQASFERYIGELRLKRQLLDQMLAASEVD